MRPAARDAQPAPKTGVRRFFYLLKNQFFALIGINFIFLLTCIPIVTIPASCCAVNRYLMKMVRDGYGFSPGDYFAEWKEELVRALPVGALTGLLFFYVCYLLSMAGQVEGGDRLYLVAYLVFDLALLFANYVFLLMANLKLCVRDAVKNTVILILVEWKSSFLLLALGTSLLAAVLMFFPWSAVAVFILPAVYQLAVCCILNGPLERRILLPYREMQSKSV